MTKIRDLRHRFQVGQRSYVIEVTGSGAGSMDHLYRACPMICSIMGTMSGKVVRVVFDELNLLLPNILDADQ
jgi:hypothetical protein